MRDTRETFAQAVKTDRTLPAEQKAYWLAACRIERYQKKQARRRVNRAKRALQSAEDKAKQFQRGGKIP